jgi:hypothetical protein
VGTYAGVDVGVFSGTPDQFGDFFGSTQSSLGPFNGELMVEESGGVPVGEAGGGVGFGEGVTSFAGSTYTATSGDLPDGAYVMLPFLALPMLAVDIINGH